MRISDWGSDVCSSDLEESVWIRAHRHDEHGSHDRVKWIAQISIAGIDRDRFGPVLVDDLLQLRCDFVERLVGGDGSILTVGTTPQCVKDPMGRIMPFRPSSVDLDRWNKCVHYG